MLNLRSARSAVRNALLVLGCVLLVTVGACGQRPDQAGTSPSGDPTSGGSSSGSAAPGENPSQAPSGTAPASASPSKSSSPSPTGPPMLLDSIVPADGATVGVAMPIVVIFSKPVKTSKAARSTIEKAMKLTTSKPVTGAWHWMGNRQVEFRPKGYWPSGDKVTLDAQFKNVTDGHGRYGKHGYKHTFTVGSKLETKISAKHHTTKVYSNGKHVRTMPSDAGSSDFPSWTGTMAVVETVRKEHMTSCSAKVTCNKNSPDYYDDWYPYAVRLTYSGTFVHYSDADPQPGHGEGSHGCVHLSLANSKWYYKKIKVGDPVTITGSPRGKASADNGYAAYNLSWSQWQSESGLGSFRTHA